ncbi:hypothetical protein EH223_11890 [candidate division KSB1 bacterium]|nr:hypothetical protein [candidate division KSB1 bacterium]RQW02699.1 MAG: hypothetical protein EH223_11890 [candidate division KSB1 bacterium]
MRDSRILVFGFMFVYLALENFYLVASAAPIVSHEQIGDVIDASENERYNFFGDIPGLSGAQFMAKGKQTYCLYLVRNSAERAQFLSLDLGEQRLEEIRIKIAGRINRIDQGGQISEALFPIAESLWNEKSAHKKVILRDGSHLYCTLFRAQNDTLIIKTDSGLIVPVPLSVIAHVVDETTRISEGKYYRSDPHSTRLFFGPTARQLKGGSGYFADYYIFFPTVAVGVMDYLAIAGGMSLVPGLPIPEQLYYFMPKVTFKTSERLGIGGGMLFLFLPEDTENVSLAYGITTYGKEEGALTLGLGFPLGSGALTFPVLLFGGEIQISNGAKLMSENWVFTGEEGATVLSAGIRFFGDRIAVDLAFLTSPEAFAESEGFPFLPWVDFSITFGK